MNSATTGNSPSVFKKILIILSVTAIIVVAASTIVLVDETELVIVERFGRISAVYDRPADRGLHFKFPWPIGSVRRFDRRVQIFDPPGREVFTRDKKNLTVEAYICWKIAEPALSSSDDASERPVVKFFRGIGSVDLAEARFDSRLRSILSTETGRVDLSDLLTVNNSEAGPNDDKSGPLDRLSQQLKSQLGREQADGASLRDQLGVEIVDVRIKRLNFPLGNQQAVFERMKSERKKIADRYRSAGLAEHNMIRSQADRRYQEVLSRAQAEAERIRGDAEAEALRTLNEAHALDPEFFQYLAALDTYEQIIGEKTTLVLSASSGFLKLFIDGIPEIPNSKINRDRPSRDVSPAIDGNTTEVKPEKSIKAAKADPVSVPENTEGSP
ncbi:MAG: protease modulator HflC [Planctomycetota bacterium]|nr:protease modulator HflC [Planctomycetota bacterium]MDA1211296.1 protease modulator HflC [Planctomycetota bacterium]